jgi:tetratricopeptide (TPR) repeat protein
VAGPVQHIDLVPTILDLVRAPVPGDLRGRSLRAVLDDADAAVGEQPVYSESLAARHRFGGHPVFALTSADYRYIRGRDETLIALRPPEPGVGGGESAAMGRLRAELDRLIAEAAAEPPQPIAAEERYALFGYLAMPRIAPLAGTTLDAAQQLAVADAHYAAAVLIGQKRYSAGIRALQAILLSHPALTVVHYQVGTVLARTGRLEEAIGAFRAARELRPEEAALALALADALMRAGQIEAAGEQALDAVALAPDGDARQQAAAHEMAARVALARQDAEAATRHAEAAYDADPAVPVPAFVRGRLRYEQSEYEEAAAAFEDAVAALQERGGAPVPDLHLYLGETLTHLGRYAEAEAEYREELRAFPRNMRAYAGLATLYHASNRDDSVEDVLNELVSATPTPEVYEVAARLWTMFGDRSRAEALRSDGETRFRGDPSLALLGRDVRR